MGAVDDYLGSLDPTTRDAFEGVRRLVMEIAPDAEQGTSYGMAALTYKGSPLLAFRAAKDHLSIFPFSADAIDAARDRLLGFQLSRGTVRFTPETPLPKQAVWQIVEHRVAEIEQKIAARRPRA